MALLALTAMAAANPLPAVARGGGPAVPSGPVQSAAERLASYRAHLARLAAGDPARADILLTLAEIETDAGDYPSAQRHAFEASSLYAVRGDVGRRGRALNRVGLASTYAGDYQLAGRMLKIAVALSKAAGDDETLAEQTTNLANVSFFLGRYADAAASYDAALRIADSHRDQAWSSRRRIIALVNEATLDQ